MILKKKIVIQSECMMRRVHFCEQWITWIRGCISSGSVSVLVNGSPTTEFIPEKGLRQGDLLAPFLFLIVAEGLNGLVKKAIQINKFKGVTVGSESQVEVSILQFADDTLFFEDASLQNVSTLKCILRCFELASGLRVNFHKSSCGGVAVEDSVMNSF